MIKGAVVIAFICGIAWAAWLLMRDKPKQPEQKETKPKK